MGSVSIMHQPCSEPIKLDFEAQRKRIQSFLPEGLNEDLDKGLKLSRSFLFQQPVTTVLFTKTEITKFVTGSKYIGQWNDLGIAGKGIYKFPHGVIYDGHFNQNGEFHGSGIIIYPNGQTLEGFWKNGKLMSGTATKDNFISNKDYCRMPDRRFQLEVENDFKPAGQEFRTNEVSPKVIPEGCYDAGDGFYDPQRRIILNYANTNVFKTISEYPYWVDEETQTSYFKILRVTLSDEKLLHRLKSRYAQIDAPKSNVPRRTADEWIKANCRKAWDEPTGYLPELYETWTTGRVKCEPSDSTCLITVKSPSTSLDSAARLSSNFENSFDVCLEIDPLLLPFMEDSEGDIFNTVSSQMRSLMFAKTIRADVLNKLIFDKLHQMSLIKQESNTEKHHSRHYIEHLVDSKHHVVKKLT